MQQAVLEEGPGGASAAPQQQPNTCSYDTLFPALPESSASTQPQSPLHTQYHTKMRVTTSNVTQVFRVPYEERKMDHSDKFGETEAYPCLAIMNGTGAHIEMSSSKDGSLTFLVTGKPADVMEARRKILTQFQTQISKQISIPKEHHRWILGKQGQKLRDLEKNTSTKINIPSASDTSELISIQGTRENIEKAEHEIRVCSDEQSKKAFERFSIPSIYHPFIVGAYNENLNQLMAETGVRINIPPPSSGKDELTIAGEKEGVMSAKKKIEAIYRNMEKRCTTVSVEVLKAQHKYVIGPKGSTIAEILQSTGVSVEMPPSDSATGTITLRGPHDKLGLALSKVYEKANSVVVQTVEAPGWIHRHIIGRKGENIRKITQGFAKVHIEFVDDKIKIEGPPEEVERAQAELQAVTKDFLANLTFVELNVDPKYFKHIIGKNGANVNRLKDETNVTINIYDTNMIRIEGTADGVRQVQTELQDLIDKMENEKEKDVIIDQRHYRSIIGTKGENIKEIRDKFNQVQINFPTPRDKRDVVKIRGVKEDVDRCHKHLMKLVKELNEQSYSVEVPIFKQFHKFIIGKGGANIRKIRDETHTKVDLPAEGDDNEVIRITGRKDNVEDAKERILKIQNELANIVMQEVTIPPKFYNSLIGMGGKLIHSIQEECGNVAIKFPTADSNSDKVSIRGPKEDVERAKQQLLEHTNEKQLSSFRAEVRAKPQHHKFLIGKNGANVKKIREATGARIVFPSDKDEDKELIIIIGREDAVAQARADLETMVKDIDNTVESTIPIDPRHHKHFVARRGDVLHRITEECGGVLISFPRSGDPSDLVRLKGARECIEAAKTRILEIVAEQEAMITIDCVIPQRHHRTVMGAKGCKVQSVTSEFDVQIKFPERDSGGPDEYQHLDLSSVDMNGEVTDPASPTATVGATSEPRAGDVIRITGKLENCEAARRALLDLVPITDEVHVPFALHGSIIGQRGRDVRTLMSMYDVHIALSPQEQKSDAIKITGTPANVERAKEAIQDRCKQIEAENEDRKLKSYELKLEVSPDYHPKIIGRKGAVITKIRIDHDVQINLPKKGSPDDNIITIVGYEENAHKARDDIMKIVNELNELVKEDVEIDSRVHSRLIGARGRNIRKIMDDYKVDIKFPHSDDSDHDHVTLTGHEENVADAKDHLLNLAEEYLQDIVDKEMYRAPSSRDATPGSQRGAAYEAREFVVKGAPWEQKAPNTESVKEFPSFRRSGGSGSEGGPTPVTSPATPVAWGPRH